MWRQKLYAFVLRRALGPLLSPTRRDAVLSECVDVSLGEGRFLLRDVELDPKYCTEAILGPLLLSGSDGAGQSDLEVRRVSVERLVITLSLGGGGGGGGGGRRPIAGEGGNGNGGGIRAQVELRGLRVDLGPAAAVVPPPGGGRRRARPPPPSDPPPWATATTTTVADGAASGGGGGGFLSSYVDAALASLRVDVRDARLRLFGGPPRSGDAEGASDGGDSDRDRDHGGWVEIGLSSLSYYDLSTSPAEDARQGGGGGGTTNGETAPGSSTADFEEIVVLRKAVDLSGLTISVRPPGPGPGTGPGPGGGGSTDDTSRRSSPEAGDGVAVVAETHGRGTVRLRVVQRRRLQRRRRGATDDPEVTAASDEKTAAEEETTTRVLHHVDVDLDQRWTATIDGDHYRCISNVLGRVAGAARSTRDGPPRASEDDDGGEAVGRRNYDAADTVVPSGATRALGEAPTATTTNGGTAADPATIGREVEGGGNLNGATIDGRYFRARTLAERGEMVGGLLVPTSSPSRGGGGYDLGLGLGIGGGIFDDDDVREMREEGVVDEAGAASYDAFFDCTDRSFSMYLSLVRPPVDRDAVSTRVTFRLADVSLRLVDRVSGAETTGAHIGGDDDAYVHVSFGDVNVTATLAETESTLRAEVYHFHLEDCFPRRSDDDGRGGAIATTPDIGSLVRFVEERDEASSYVISSPPSFCLTVRQSQLTRKGQEHAKTESSTQKAAALERHVDVSLLPMELTYRESTVSFLRRFLATPDSKTTSRRSGPTGADETLPRDDEDVQHMRTSFVCSSPLVTILVPIVGGRDAAESNVARRRMGTMDHLLARGHDHSPSDGLPTARPSLGVALDAFSVDFSEEVIPRRVEVHRPADDVGGAGSSVTASFDVASFFFVGPSDLVYSRGRGSKRFDFLRLSGGTDDVVVGTGGGGCCNGAGAVRVRYARSNRRPSELPPTVRGGGAGHTFPVVPPLSSVKVRQDQESSTDADDHVIRGKNPQDSMLREALRCEDTLDVCVPFFVLDLTVRERECLLELLAQLVGGSGDRKSDAPADTPPMAEKITTPLDDGPNAAGDNSSSMSVSFCCDQGILLLHESPSSVGRTRGCSTPSSNASFGDDCCENTACFILAADDLKCHAVAVDGKGLTQTRFLAQDFTAYEAYYTSNSNSLVHGPLNNGKGRILHGLPHFDTSNAIVHRSKLGQPLSPKTPAVHLDYIKKTFSNADSSTHDSELHLSLYDMTYRYVYESVWFQRFVAVLKGEQQKPPVNDDRAALTTEIETESTSDCSADTGLIMLFVTLSDCHVDYTSPVQNFQRAARALVRFGEIHVSSNVVPDAPVQAYKLSLADVSVHLSNHRYPYNSENARLSHCRQILREKDMEIAPAYVDLEALRDAPLDEVLSKMAFVNVAALDSLDSFVTVNSFIIGDVNKKCSVPDVVATLKLGRLSLYSCRDSFACLTEAIGEWLLKMTALSEEQIAAAKAAISPEISNEELPKDGIDHAKPNHHRDFHITAESQHVSISSPNGPEGESVSLLDVIEENMFVQRNNDIADMPPDEVYLNGDGERNAPFADIPDSELSATELRKKHNVIDMDDLATNLAKSLLIKNYYTVDTSKENLPLPTNGHGSRNSTDGEVEDDDLTSMLDGYDWTTVDHGWSPDSDFSREVDQFATWYSSKGADENSAVDSSSNKGDSHVLQIFPQHVPVTPVRDPLAEGDMNAAKLAGVDDPPHVPVRVLVKDMSVVCRFFDGLDWACTHRRKLSRADKSSNGGSRRRELLGELLETGEDQDPAESNLFPEDKKGRSVSIRKGRQVDTFFEFCMTGVQLRLDTFAQSTEYRLASCMDMKVMDFFVSESISRSFPQKMLGEWVNDKEHPRDTNDGMIMMKMMSMRPNCLISADGKLMSDESRMTLELLPLRCHIDQVALRFVRDFFSGDEEGNENSGSHKDTPESSANESETDDVGTFFERCTINPCKLKVNYNPVGVDTAALRDGCYIEVLNLFSLEDMELTLQTVEMSDLTGWGAVFSEMACRWIEDICATQMHKFVTGATPFHSISTLGGGVADLVLIPVHHYRREGKIVKGMRKATSSLAGTVALETLNTTSKLTGSVAKALSKVSSRARPKGIVALPARPEAVPCSVTDTAAHAYESVSRGLQVCSYTIVVVPRREFKKNGTTGAIKSVVRAIPVAVLAPLSGASEALSYALLGVRNQLRPDIRKEEEARQRGLR